MRYQLSVLVFQLCLHHFFVSILLSHLFFKMISYLVLRTYVRQRPHAIIQP